MSFTLHHVNVPAADVPTTARFFETVVGLRQGRWIYPRNHGDLHHGPDGLAFFGICNGGLHVVRLVPGFARERGFAHNPTVGGHVAISVAEVGSFLGRAREAGYEVSDAGTYAMAGMHQTYVFDPSGNLVEINAVLAPLPAADVATQDPEADVDLHHVVLPSHDLERSIPFYRDVVGLGEPVVRKRGRLRWAAFGARCRGLVLLAHQARYATAPHNPSLAGSVTLAVADLDAIVARATAQQIVVGDVDDDPLVEGRQVFLYTPSMRVVGLVEAA